MQMISFTISALTSVRFCVQQWIPIGLKGPVCLKSMLTVPPCRLCRSLLSIFCVLRQCVLALSKTFIYEGTLVRSSATLHLLFKSENGRRQFQLVSRAEIPSRCLQSTSRPKCQSASAQEETFEVWSCSSQGSKGHQAEKCLYQMSYKQNHGSAP